MTSASETRPALAGEILLLFLLATLWGASFSLIKLAITTIPPVTLTTARIFLAFLVLASIMAWRGLRLPADWRVWRRFAVQSAIGSLVPSTLIAWGQLTVDASLAAILNSSSPIFAFLMTWGVTRHETVTGRKLFGVVMGMAGVVLIIGLSAAAGLGREVVSQMAIAGASVCYAMAAIHGRVFAGYDPMVTAAGTSLAGSLMFLPLSLLVDAPWTLRPSGLSLVALVGLAVFSTAMALAIYYRLIRTLGTVGTTAQAYLRVPIGVAIGVIFLGETLTPTAWVGLICVMIGVAAMTHPGRGRAAS